ncbi:MAG: DsbA family protein [Candidatus Binataceae bacterium]
MNSGKFTTLAKLPVVVLSFALLTIAASALAARAPIFSASQDNHLKEFLQKRFHIAHIKEIVLGPAIPSPFPGLWTRTVTVTAPDGHQARVTLYANRAEDKVILGQYLDLHGDPWGRINISKLHLKDRAELGPADAPVTIVEFADFECPFCARAFPQIETLVHDKYKGKVKLIFKNFPLSMHPWARQAAIAAECIRRQNPAEFWNFAEVLYSSQAQINPMNLRERIDAFVKAEKLDPSLLNACVMGKSAERQVAQDVRDAMAAHVQSTPTFFIDGIPVVGLPEDKVFGYVINSELHTPPSQRETSGALSSDQ